jgi:outer membrane protein
MDDTWDDMWDQGSDVSLRVDAGGVSRGGLSRIVLIAAAVLGLWGWAGEARAQQKIGYVDTQAILKKLPEYATVQQTLDELETKWRAEIENQKEKVQTLRDEFQASELLYTEEERKQKRRAIEQAQQKVEQLRQRYFGPKGQLYTRQKKLMRPIQKRILSAAEEVATEEGYDYVLDKSEKVLFLYAREEHNLNRLVLRKLGITPDQRAEGR